MSQMKFNLKSESKLAVVGSESEKKWEIKAFLSFDVLRVLIWCQDSCCTGDLIMQILSAGYKFWA
jgi:hypothetical protein